MSSHYVLGDGKRKSRYDPSLAERVNSESGEPQQPAGEIVNDEDVGLAKPGIYVATFNEAKWRDNKPDSATLWRVTDDRKIVEEMTCMNLIAALSAYNGRIYGSSLNLFVLGTKITDVSDRQIQGISALCSHKGELYAVKNKRVYRPLRDPGLKRSLDKRPNDIKAIVSHDGSFFHAMYVNGPAGLGSCIARISDDFQKVLEGYVRPGVVRSLCSHAGILYDGGEAGIFKTLEDKQSEHPLSSWGIKDTVGMCSYKGQFYHAREEGKLWRGFNDFDGLMLHYFGDKGDKITAICALEEKS